MHQSVVEGESKWRSTDPIADEGHRDRQRKPHSENDVSRPATMLDADVTAQDVHSLRGADAVTAFFARLNYNTNARVKQTPANLGITADNLVKQVKKAELIADHDGLLQVYLFELNSVTVAATQGLARAFKNRAGNYLLLLTSDYDRIDFVLLERTLPTPGEFSKMTQKQAGVLPRPLTINRKDPELRHLRVLRRLTYTESDPFYQYEKLRSAFDIAYWSTDFFDNRALFSDYYLENRLRDTGEWQEDPSAAYRDLVRLFADARGRWANKPEAEIRSGLFAPILDVLGFKPKERKTARSSAEEPDYHLMTPNGKTHLADCLVYPWGRSLDGPDDQRDSETPEENPGALVVSLLERGDAQWAVVTNGKHWRLYAARAHNKATNYYELDLEEVLSRQDPNESFRYFWLIFRRQALELTAEAIEHAETKAEPKKRCFLDRLFEDSQEYAKKLGERLKDRVFEQISPHFAEGFVEHIRESEGVARADIPQERLDQVFQGTLTFLYRLLFLLYAESRDLLPVKEARGYGEKSLARLKTEAADAAGTLEDDAPEKLKKRYATDSHELYDRLADLFAIVDKGDSARNVPCYNGGLFMTDPPNDDETPEAANARFLRDHKIPDRFLALGLDLIARDEDEKTLKLVPIDYKSLGVRQLGSIYEGLLEFKLRIAREKMAIVKGKKTDEVMPYAEAVAEKRQVLTNGRGRDAKERTYGRGTVYLENDRRERKATGSYYTPDYIVKHIVEHTVGPVLDKKFEAMRPKLREAQRKHQEFLKRQEAFRTQKMKTEPDEKGDLIGREVVDELFNIRVLDPGMGSAHFLVESVDVISNRVIVFLNEFSPWNPVTAHLKRMREAILRQMEEQGITVDERRLTDVNLLKRHILKRCVYGVDLNPMAVELAKVSLWLDCFTLGAPLSFLDHHMKCGNSLIGATVEEVRKEVEGGGQSRVQLHMWGSQFAGLMLATDLMRHVGELSDLTTAQVSESRSEYRKAADALAPFKRMLDVYTSQWFGNPPRTVGSGPRGKEINDAVDFLKGNTCEAWARNPDAMPSDLVDRKVAEGAVKDQREKRFFHWELEFPEVFYGPRQGTRQAIERLEQAGFDAVVGNPPWGQKEIERDGPAQRFTQQRYPSACGVFDLFRPFVELAIRLAAPGGWFGLILPDILLLKDVGETRRFILNESSITAIDWWGMAFEGVVMDTCSVVGQAGQSDAQHVVDVQVHDPKNPISHKVLQSDFARNTDQVFNLFLTSDKRMVLQHLSRCPRLGDYFEIHEGVHSGNMRDELFVEGRVDDTCRPLLFGRDEIAPYVLTWNGLYLRLGAVPRRRTQARYANVGRPEWYAHDKVLIRRTGDFILAAVDTDGRYASNNFFLVLPSASCSLNVYGLCALLNSRFMTWYFRLIHPREGRVFAEVKIKHLKEFPLPECALKESGCDVLNDLGFQRSVLAHQQKTHAMAEQCDKLRETGRQLDKRIETTILESFGLSGNHEGLYEEVRHE